MEERYDDEDDGEFRPGDPDYELSEAHGYLWDPPERAFPPRWLIVSLTVLVIAGLVIPTIIIILRS